MSDSVYTVAEINQRVRALLLENFSEVVVRGEISGLRRYASGHWYFTLKDSASEIRCAMFQTQNQRVAFDPKDGDAVQVMARVDLYVQRGTYQLVIEDMKPEGRGELLRRLEEMRIRLRDEGLFDSDRKLPLPPYPMTIGVVTSSDGAALRDVARALRRRWPVARLLVYPSRVQGEGAPATLVRALNLACRDNRCDVLILARGGGSLEDLLAFSDEMVVRAVAACEIPLITGVGHETDTSLADLAADVRAATPTAAAELASPDVAALKQRSERFLARIHSLLSARLKQAQQALDHLSHRLDLAHPAAKIQGHQQRLDEIFERLVQAPRRHVERRSHRLTLSHRRLLSCSPKTRLDELERAAQQYQWRLDAASRNLRQALRARLDQASGTLEAVSPLRTLERGYAIATLKTPNGPKIIREAGQARVGDAFDLRVADGSISAKVTDAKPTDATK